MFNGFRTAAFVVVAGLASPQAYPQTPSQTPFRLGVVIAKVAALQDPQQSYALYLPKSYTAESRWAIVYVFDPLARGELALRQFEHAAEVQGFIVAASNNSRNGPWPPQSGAAEAMVNDTWQRFSVDTKRIYFAGFSGGARVASQLALFCKCAAGVLLSGAGFPRNSPPLPGSKFVVFSAVGNADFNYSEVVPLQDQLEKALLPHWLRIFDGDHEWASPAVIDEALAWFRMQEMKSNLNPRSDEFISVQFAAAKQRAEFFEKAGELLPASREYRQTASTFDGFADVAAIRARADFLDRDKAVRDALKREHNAFDEQSGLSDEVLSAVSHPPDYGPNSDQLAPRTAPQLARDLRQRFLNDKRPDHTVVLKRALGAVFIGSIESGNSALEKKDYPLAAQYFACAAEASPESEWVFRQLAAARALSGDRKGAIEALRSAHKVTKNLNAFSSWLDEEASLSSLRALPEFKTLRAP